MRYRLNDSLAIIAAMLAFSAVTFAQTYGTPGYAPGTWKPQEVPKIFPSPNPSTLATSPEFGRRPPRRVILKGMPSTTSGCRSRIRAFQTR